MDVQQWTLRKRDYSVNPWRLGFLDSAGDFHEYWYANCPMSFPRKRDGLPTLAAIQALQVDWTQDARTWPQADQQALTAILEGTGAWQQWRALTTRRAPQGGAHAH